MQVWQVAPRDAPSAFVAARTTARRLRHSPAVAFAKVLGTASDDFVPTSATPRRWAVLTCWRAQAADRADDRLTSWWTRHAVESASLSLRPMRSRGTWDGRAPFAAVPEQRWDGAVLALTRSTVRATKAVRFYRAVPAIAAELRASAGCRLAFGIGEAPLLRQGTISVWESEQAMRRFAYSAPQHVAAVTATPRRRWYAEDLFARFAVIEARGSIDGVSLA